jgi:hypothetical protein
MKKNIKKLICLGLVAIFLLSMNSAISADSIIGKEDFDPLVDVEVTVEIQKIRAFDKYDNQVHRLEYVDLTSAPDFYVKVFINDGEFTSDIWQDTKYIYDTPFSATFNVPDEEEFVDIKIQLWDWNSNGDKLCDIGNENDDVGVSYSIKTGHWTGDDQLEDPSGYGRLNGCDDGSMYRHDRDCELWFNIFQNDYDNDNIPYWVEVNEYGTDPEVDNTGDDDDFDDVPIEWEWKWGYDPFASDNHASIDPEGDSIDNVEEYLTSQWGSDPFRKDVFTELDQMQESPSGQESLLPDKSKELLYTAFNRQNVVYHLDDGRWEETGSEMIPFDESTSRGELSNIYYQHFLNGDSWRRGVFHYGVLLYEYAEISGCVFGSNRFQISSTGMEQKASIPFLNRDIVYASAYMHETGHTFDFYPIPGHNQWSKSPWQIGWWINRPYKSCMNYGYMYTTVDYSDGSRQLFEDYDDWTRMDFSYFEDSWN